MTDYSVSQVRVRTLRRPRGYNTARAAPTPALNALTTLLLAASLIAVTVGYLGYRWFTRGEKGAAIDVFAGEA